MAEIKSNHQDLMNRLTDISTKWTYESLMAVIERELRNDSSSLNMVLIDTAAARVLQLEGKELTNQNLHQIEERIMQDILRKELGLPR